MDEQSATDDMLCNCPLEDSTQKANGSRSNENSDEMPEGIATLGQRSTRQRSIDLRV